MICILILIIIVLRLRIAVVISRRISTLFRLPCPFFCLYSASPQIASEPRLRRISIWNIIVHWILDGCSHVILFLVLSYCHLDFSFFFGIPLIGLLGLDHFVVVLCLSNIRKLLSSTSIARRMLISICCRCSCQFGIVLLIGQVWVIHPIICISKSSNSRDLILFMTIINLHTLGYGPINISLILLFCRSMLLLLWILILLSAFINDTIA